LITAAALWLFAKEQVDYAVLEVGLGGRWDATSVVTPKVAVLTGVDFDHTAILGDSIEAIAGEKAAIIKPGSVAVLAPTKPEALAVFAAQAKRVGAKVVLADADGSGRLDGITPSYQAQNRLTAITAARELLGESFDLNLAEAAVGKTRIPGRFEILRTRPMLLIDAAHNPQSASYLAGALLESGLLEPVDGFPAPTLLLAILKDKDAAGIISALSPLFAQIAVTATASERAIAPDELAAKALSTAARPARVFASPREAIEKLTAENTPVVATGSITLAGEIKSLKPWA
jgi:dihydrofolate synthase/folylpolyglutamate synthase